MTPKQQEALIAEAKTRGLVIGQWITSLDYGFPLMIFFAPAWREKTQTLSVGCVNKSDDYYGMITIYDGKTGKWAEKIAEQKIVKRVFV